MYEKSFIKRLSNFGLKRLILSYDTFAFIITILILVRFNVDLSYSQNIKDILLLFVDVSSSLFAIVLAGLAIVTSFTDEKFVLAWKEIGEFDNLITIFQYNLILPISIMILSMFLLFIGYNSTAMMIMIGMFVYMIVSLIDLLGFVCRYGLQRGEFVKQLDEIRREPI